MLETYIEQYESLEKKHWWWLARRKILLKKILKYISGKSKSVLDIGCGSGINLMSLQEFFDCEGIEPEERLIQRARLNTRAPIYSGKLPENLPETEKQYDAILLLDVIEHIDDDISALRAVKKYMKRDSILVLNVPAMPSLWSIHDEVNEHKRRYEFHQLQKVIQEAGFSVMEMDYWGTSLVPLAKIRQFLHRNTLQKDYKVGLPGPWMNALLEKALLAELKWSFVRPKAGLSLMAILKQV